MGYIPEHIIFDILLHLSLEEVLKCRCICRAWREIISKPQFTEQYFARATRSQRYLIIRPHGNLRVAREILHVDPQNYIGDTTSRVSLKTAFKIPVNNFQTVLNSEIYTLLIGEADGDKKKRWFKSHHEELFLNIMNTCNGFLCLSRYNTVMIANPVTGDFVNVPVPTPAAEDEIHLVRYALGFCSRTESYKVIRLHGIHNETSWAICPSTGLPCSRSSSAQLCVLGSSLWQNIGLAPAYSSIYDPLYLNGRLYWLYDEWSGPKFLVYFNFDSDSFTSLSLPLVYHVEMVPWRLLASRNTSRIGVLRDHLCFCDSSCASLDVWLLTDENGDQGVWELICSVRLSGIKRSIKAHGYYQPITWLEGGVIVLYDCESFGLVYYELGTERVDYLRIQGPIVADYEAISYNPTFRALKDVLVGHEVEVLNINSRCGNLKIPREGSPVLLVRKKITK